MRTEAGSSPARVFWDTTTRRWPSCSNSGVSVDSGQSWSRLGVDERGHPRSVARELSGHFQQRALAIEFLST